MARQAHHERALDADRLALFRFLDSIHAIKRVGLVATDNGHAITWAILTGVRWTLEPGLRVEFRDDAAR